MTSSICKYLTLLTFFISKIFTKSIIYPHSLQNYEIRIVLLFPVKNRLTLLGGIKILTRLASLIILIMQWLRLHVSPNYPCCESKPRLLTRGRDDRNRSLDDNGVKKSRREEGSKFLSMKSIMQICNLRTLHEERFVFAGQRQNNNEEFNKDNLPLLLPTCNTIYSFSGTYFYYKLTLSSNNTNANYLVL